MASLITARHGDTESLTLVQTGFVHSQRFIVYAELVDYRDLNDGEFTEGAEIHCEAEKLDGEYTGWWREIDQTVVPAFSQRTSSQTQVIWNARLDPGHWRIVLRVNGRIVADREIEVLETPG